MKITPVIRPPEEYEVVLSRQFLDDFIQVMCRNISIPNLFKADGDKASLDAFRRLESYREEFKLALYPPEDERE